MEPAKPHRIPLEMDKPLPSHTGPNSAGGNPGPAPEAKPAGEPLSPGQVQDIEDKIVAAIKTCFDPEIPVNIHELGLIYGIDVQESGDVEIRMTLTSPACPVAGTLPPEVQA